MADELANAELEDAWALYIAAEANGARNEKADALRRLVASVQSQDRSAQVAFVEWYCRNHLDSREKGEGDISGGPWMRLPLFREVFVDVLETGRIQSRPNYARWMAQLYALLCRRNGSYLIYEPTREALLAEALDLDPGDDRARAMLVSALLSRVEYVCHELPHGLLCDPGRLIEDADRLQSLLAGTVWHRLSLRGSAALRLVALGDRHDDVVGDVDEYARLRCAIQDSLFPPR